MSTPLPQDRAAPRYRRFAHLPRQLLRKNPFAGTLNPVRVPLLSLTSGRPTLPFPHPWNYRTPLRILDTFFWNADADAGPGRHTRYLDVPGFAPVLVTRDPSLIRAISTQTGDQPGMFDRDTLPSSGIARATGEDTLLYANGPAWKRQKKLATPPFARTTLFQPEQFRDFARTFRQTVRTRLERVREKVHATGGPVRVHLEPEIKALMLEMLVNNFFGAQIAYDQIRDRYVPAIDRVIGHIVRDTVLAKVGIPLNRLPALTPSMKAHRQAKADFETLTDAVIAQRRHDCGLWKQFKSDAPDHALRSNIRVFLAGALEATTSYASWAISHLARNPAAQQRVYDEVRAVDDYTPEILERSRFLNCVLNETLRLTPSLYFHPRRATADTWLESSSGHTLCIPAGVHILLDVWHANRHEDHWGRAVTGFPADEFIPERWEAAAAQAKGSNELLHFGFGHGPRFCPGKSLGQLEVALVVGACVKLFAFSAPDPQNPARAGVSTKPLDGVLVDLRPQDAPTTPPAPPTDAPAARCPFAHP
jgi:cytochrome P450